MWIPKLVSMVCTSRLGSSGSNAELMRSLRGVPAIGTHKSRGNDKMAAWAEVGSTWNTMIVSDRAPAVPSPRKAPAYGDDGSMQLRLSDPVNKKLVAPTGRPPVVTSDNGEPGGVATGRVLVTGAWTRTTRCRRLICWLAHHSAIADPTQAKASTTPNPMTSRCGQVRRSRRPTARTLVVIFEMNVACQPIRRAQFAHGGDTTA